MSGALSSSGLGGSPCPSGYYEYGNYCVEAPTNNSASNCQPGFHSDGFKCVADPDPTSCQSPLVWNGSYCAYPTCDANSYFDPYANKCVLIPTNTSPSNNSGNMSGGQFPVDAAPEESSGSRSDVTIAGGTLALFWALNRRRYADG